MDHEEEILKQENPAGESGGRAAVRLSPGKKLLFSAIFTGVGLALIELTCFLLLNFLPGYDPGGLQAYHSDFTAGREGQVFVTKKAAAELNSLLDETILFNMIGNAVTYPDPKLIFRVRPGAGSQPEFADLKINSLGFRGEEFELDAKPDRRVMVLGDSCAFGWWIPDFSQTWVRQLELLLDEHLGDTQVFNFGQPGYSTFQCSILYDRWFHKIQPDYLIIYAGWNDLHGAKISDGQTVKLLRGSMSPATGWFRKSYTFDLIEQSVMKYRIANVKTKGRMHNTRRRVPPAQSIENFERIVSTSREANCGVIVVMPPFSSERAPDKVNRTGFGNMLEFREKLSEALREEALLVSFQEMEYTQPDSPRYFVEGDGYHPNATGALLMSRGLAQAIMLLEKNRASGAAQD